MIRSCVISSNGFVNPIEIRPAWLFALTYLSLQGGAAALASMLIPIPAAPVALQRGVAHVHAGDPAVFVVAAPPSPHRGRNR